MSKTTQDAGPRDPMPPPGAAVGLTDTERERIGRRARAMWWEAGCPDGRDREFWEQAELQVLKGGVKS